MKECPGPLVSDYQRLGGVDLASRFCRWFCQCRSRLTIPPAVVADLRTHWKAAQEQRLALGLGGSAPTDLVFTMWDGSPRKPNALTNDWLRASMVTGRRINLHALRHTHASSLTLPEWIS